MNDNYQDDLYDDRDYYVERKMSVLRKEMYIHIIMGVGLGIMLTLGMATAVAWVMG